MIHSNIENFRFIRVKLEALICQIELNSIRKAIGIFGGFRSNIFAINFGASSIDLSIIIYPIIRTMK